MKTETTPGFSDHIFWEYLLGKMNILCISKGIYNVPHMKRKLGKKNDLSTQQQMASFLWLRGKLKQVVKC